MDNADLKKQYQKILGLIESTNVSTHDDLELQGHWGKYLCVLVSGFLENSISAVFSDFVTQAASPHVSQFTLKTLEKIQNPKASRFVTIAYQFKKEWGVALEQYFEVHPEKKQAIDSIMTNRHLIVHGKTTNISVHRVSDYLTQSVDVIDFIEKMCANKINI